MFRLHVDIALGENETEALNRANEIIQDLISHGMNSSKFVRVGDTIQYKLCSDNERSGRNYLIIRENGCPANKKCTHMF